MPAQYLHVRPYGDGWDVIQDGARYANSHHATQAAAIRAGTRDARRDGVALLIHEADGRICNQCAFEQDTFALA
ncbi:MULTISPECIES: DUF2188 domain-containing protein [Cupriavidus]|uniref:DUF2188 domain-containing protein n=1 Tax=Cupriavidus TaxID=106589 RepID=UPI000366B7DE|nr:MULTISPECIES: DUF2188 domain-containing protein [Cupriavidus]